jgi:hypothetical protein
MLETLRRRWNIAKELATWSDALPHLLRKLDAALELASLTPTQRFDLELMVVRIEAVFRAIDAAVGADATYERSIATMDRLREEMTATAAARRSSTLVCDLRAAR